MNVTASEFVPIIDIAPYLKGTAEGKRQVADAVGRACREVGFYIITGHAVEPQLLDKAETTARAFFDLPIAEKMKIHVGDTPGGVGYAAMGDVSLALTRGIIGPHDLNESFQIAKIDRDDSPYFHTEAAKGLMPQNQWPAALPVMQPQLSEYYLRMGQLARDLMRISALALDLPETYFDAKISRHVSRLNLRMYPQQKQQPLPGQVRAGAHTDYGTVTILRPGDTAGGLQVADAGGNWHDVPAIPDSFVINIGDLLSRWTNDTWRSTLHRVTNPQQGTGNRRLSLIFFHHAAYDTIVDCLPSCQSESRPPRYEPVSVAEYYILKRTQQRVALQKAKANPIPA
jgi:isopenicillin N synthase-like dioxygenase